MDIKYKDLEDLRKISSEIGIQRVSMKHEETLVNELKTFEGVNSVTKVENEDDQVEENVESKEVQTSNSEEPQEKDQDSIPSKTDGEKLEDEIAQLNRQIQLKRDEIKELEEKSRKLSSKRVAAGNRPLPELVKEFQKDLMTSPALKRAAEMRSLKRAAEAKVARKYNMINSNK